MITCLWGPVEMKLNSKSTHRIRLRTCILRVHAALKTLPIVPPDDTCQ